MHNDQAEQDFWRQFMAKKGQYAPDPSSRPVAAFLQGKIAELGIQSVLELGPGWGNYTLDFAQSCKEVACVDISKDVLDYIEQTGAQQGFHNITSHHVKWEEFVSPRQYDLVFGYNCFYRLEDLAAAFWKMNRSADVLCVAGMNTGIAPPWFHELEQSGASVSWEWKDCIYFVNILYQMGIDADVKIFPFTKQLRYASKEELLARECGKLKAGHYDPKAAEEILLKHFQQNDQGEFTAQAHYRSALVMWQACGEEIGYEG